MSSTVRGAIGAAVLLALTVESTPLQTHQVLEVRGRCNGDNLLNRFRDNRYTSQAVGFCQTLLDLYTTQTETVTAAAADIPTSPWVTAKSTVYPSPLLTTSYPETRLSSACSCITATIITQTVTDYVVALATADSSTSSDAVTSTSDVASTSTDDASTTSDPATVASDTVQTSTDESSTTSDAATSTSDVASTSTDDSSTTSDATSSSSTADTTTSLTDAASTTSSESSAITDATAATSSDASSSTSETSSSILPTITTTGNLGCWVEPLEGHALPIKHDSPEMTVETCDSLCADYAYYGLEYGRECYCGDELAYKPYRTEPEACDVPCLGDPSQGCGGRSLLNLYKRNSADAVEPEDTGATALYEPVGCFAEPDGAKALSQVYSSVKMTHALCFSHCHAGGFSYAGLEYGQECWCGNSITGGTLLAVGQCTAPCAGDATETCGNGNVIQLYSAPL